MAISSSCLFHYTQTFESLKGILQNGFFPSYCKEELEFGEITKWYAVPVVSFCDIPLTMATAHTEDYGKFAIGLSTFWAQGNRLNPVVYLDKNSILAESIKNLSDYVEEKMDKLDFKDEKSVKDFFEVKHIETINLLKSIKNHSAFYIRNEKLGYGVYYNEREWRYSPKIKFEDALKYKYRDIFYESDFDSLTKLFPKKPHFKNSALKFEAKDIHHLIVPEEEDVLKLIKFLQEEKGLYKTNDEFLLLVSKIQSISTIRSNF